MEGHRRLWIRSVAALLVMLSVVCGAQVQVAGEGRVALPTARGEAADEAALQRQYDEAAALYDAQQYQEAAAAFEALGGYSNSKGRAIACRTKWKETRYAEAMALYDAGEYQEAKEIFVELEYYQKSQRRVRMCEDAISSESYKHAKELYKAGEYTAAKEIFVSLGKYRDCRELAEKADEMIRQTALDESERLAYEEGLACKKAGELEKARAAFINAGDHLDATDQLYAVIVMIAQQDAYRRAEDSSAAGDDQSAYELYTELGDYEDSADKAARCAENRKVALYEQATAAQDDDPGRAYILFVALEDYRDSRALAEALRATATDMAIYNAADALAQAGESELALCGFEAVSAYEDAKDRAKLLREETQNAANFRHAMYLRSVWQLEEANAIFKPLKLYNSAVQMILKKRFTATQLRDMYITPESDVFTAPDGSAHHYRIYKGVAKWSEARAFCEALGGHLATLTTAEENAFVYRFMWDSGVTTAYFGLSDEARNGNWVWVTGEPFEYSNWHKGQPSYSGTGKAAERYGMYLFKHLDGTWNDAHFYEHWENLFCPFICEWDD